MSKIKNLRLEQDEVSQTINLKDIFGFDVSRNTALKLAAGQAAIDYMLERTKSGVDYNGKAFARYSKEYMESLEFSAFGKSSQVDMELTGEMLGSIDLEDLPGNEIKISIKGEPAARAYGHMTGMKGHPTLEGKAPVREFFGVRESELKSIGRDFMPSSPKDRIGDAALSGISKLLQGLKDGK